MVLMHFCRRFGQLYGKEAITPNMHLHAHLRECIQDYGPIYSFWLFSFERYNGMLGNFPNNQRSIEIQLPLSVCYYTYCTNGCEKIGTQNHLRCKKYSYVLGSPVSQQHLESDGVDFQPGQVETILMHQFEYNGSRYINVFALVNWFAAHSMRFKFGNPLQLWSRTFYNKHVCLFVEFILSL